MVTYYDPRKRTRITVTTPQERAKRRKAAKQFAQNSKSALLVQMMQLMLKMSQTKEKAEQNYLTTPVDKWTEIDRAKNEMVALGKGVDDIVKGIKALDTDLSLMRRGLGDGLTNWNKFMAADASPIIEATVSGMGFSTSEMGTDTEDLINTLPELRSAVRNTLNLETSDKIYKVYFNTKGSLRKDYKELPYTEVYELMKNDVEEREELSGPSV